MLVCGGLRLWWLLLLWRRCGRSSHFLRGWVVCVVVVIAVVVVVVPRTPWPHFRGHLDGAVPIELCDPTNRTRVMSVKALEETSEGTARQEPADSQPACGSCPGLKGNLRRQSGDKAKQTTGLSQTTTSTPLCSTQRSHSQMLVKLHAQRDLKGGRTALQLHSATSSVLLSTLYLCGE